ncbi:hypothetical protein BH11MYX4_BH11MYX4_58580 [soil metagenome]
MRWFVGPAGWPHNFFGLYDEATDSFALASDGVLASFNGNNASDALVARIHEWVDRGMPSAETMVVRAYRVVLRFFGRGRLRSSSSSARCWSGIFASRATSSKSSWGMNVLLATLS